MKDTSTAMCEYSLLYLQSTHLNYALLPSDAQALSKYFIGSNKLSCLRVYRLKQRSAWARTTILANPLRIDR